MARKNIGNPMDDGALNNINHNFTELYEGVSGANKKIQDTSRDLDNKLNNFIENTSEDAFNKVVGSARIDWDKMVDTFGDLPANATEGTTIGVKADSKVYRYDGSKWVDIYEINLNPISEVDERLSTQLAENIIFDGQVDFVNMVRDRTSYESLKVKKTDKPYESLNVFLTNGNSHISYDFQKNKNDDFWIFNTAYAGKLKTTQKFYESTSSLKGNWETSGNNKWTTEIGAEFIVHVRGERLEFNHYADKRGGLLEIVINDNYSNSIIVSTYSEEPGNSSKLIADDLNTEKVHKVVGKFIGKDPDNPPDGGVARGWIKDATGENLYDRTIIGGYLDNGTYSENKMLLGYASNKEFAFDLEFEGKRHWFPEHNNVGTAFQVEEPKIIIGDKELLFSEMVNDIPLVGSNVQFIQKIACRFPEVTDDLAILEITHSVNMSGIVTISGKIIFKRSVLIKNGYTMMFPLVGDTLKEFISSIGGHIESKGDNSIMFFQQEKNRATSFAGIDSRNQDFIAAVSFDYPFKTLKLDKTGGDKFFYVHEREGRPKLYAKIFDNSLVENYETYHFYGRYTIGNIENIYSHLS